MAYQKIESIHTVETKRPVPTVRELLKAIRRYAYPGAVAYSDGARCLEAGVRIGHNGDHTVDCSQWPEDSDLWDFESIGTVLQECRRTDPSEWPKELDLYIRDTDELLGNADLRPSPDGWKLVVVGFRYTPDPDPVERPRAPCGCDLEREYCDLCAMPDPRDTTTNTDTDN